MRAHVLIVALQHLALLCAGTVVLFLPGIAVLSWLPALRPDVRLLWPGAALTVGIVPASLLLALSLWAELPIVVTATALLGGSLLAIAAWLVARRIPVRALMPSPDRLTLGTWAIAAVGAFLGYAMGSRFKFDMLYHAGVVQKLLHFNHPSLIVTSRFVDGDPNPAYIIPVWHELIAQIAWLSHSSPLTTLWVLPALLVPLGILTAAGAVESLLDRREAAPLGALVFLLLQVLLSQHAFEGISYIAYPGNLTLSVVLPLALAMWIGALAAPTQNIWWTRMAMCLVCCAAILILHANYVFFVGVAIAGTAAALLSAEVRRDVGVRRYLTTSLTVGGAALLGLILLIPTLAALNHFARGTHSGAFDSLFEFYSDQVTGTKSSFHLRPDLLFQRNGVLALAGMLLIPFLVATRRLLTAGWAVGTLLLVIAITQCDPLFRLLLGVGSTTAGLRLGRLLELPIEVALTAAALWVAHLMRGRRFVQLVPALVFAAAVGALLAANPPGSQLPDWPVAVAAALGVLSLIPIAVPPLARRLPQATFGAFEPGTVGVVIIALAIAGSFHLGNQAHRLKRSLHQKRASASSRDEFRTVPADLRTQVRDLPERSVVMAPPTLAPRIAALAPVFVVADDKLFLADTEGNHNRERLRDAERFYREAPDSTLGTEILDRNHVDAVISEAPQRLKRRFPQ
jgi:hypothetical protein